MVRCPKCNTLGKELDLNFAKLKREGNLASKSPLLDQEFHCLNENCGHSWGLEEEALRLYDEYRPLRTEVDQMVSVGDPRKGPLPTPKPVDCKKITRMHEIAKILCEKYRHALDISASEWYEIEREASLG